MPKSNSALSSSSHNKPGSNDSTSRMSDVALRKKKNADAQAAFRARRANYIATLEETVTSLESVVLQLQDSCRDARNESQELRQENARLRHEFREREKFWRALWQTRKANPGAESEELPPLPASFSSTHIPNGHLGSPPAHHGGTNLAYRPQDDSSMCSGPYSGGGPSHYQNHSPAMPYAGVETEISGDNSSQSFHRRGQKYNPFSYSINAAPREAHWPQTITQSTSSGGDSGAPTSNHSSHSPGFVESPTLTSAEMSYVGRFPADEQKTSLNNLDNAPYVFANSRSMSPSTSTPASSSASLTTFQFTFPDLGHDRPDFDYRRHSHPHGAEVTLHGGTADISLASPASDAVRYRLGTRRANSGSDRPLLPILPPISAGSDNGSHHERGSSDGDLTPYPHPNSRSAPPRSSHSPSPGPTTLSGTLAVIKAQAFGALRRTRSRTKKSSEGAAKVAMDVLEARGIGMGASTGSKRQRLHDDELDLSPT